MYEKFIKYLEEKKVKDQFFKWYYKDWKGQSLRGKMNEGKGLDGSPLHWAFIWKRENGGSDLWSTLCKEWDARNNLNLSL